MTDQQVLVPGAPSSIPALPNLRDLGGWAGADDRPVRYGMLFRSTDFRSLGDDAELIEQVGSTLGLRTVYDFRSDAEAAAVPDPEWADVARLHLHVMADTATAIPANLSTVLTDPESVARVNEFLAGDGIAANMRAAYREMLTTDSARAGYARFYRGLLGEDRSPALFHCATGKDRTGWAAASFLTLMGVARDDVYTDYLLTNDRLVPALAPVFEKFADAGGDPDLLTDVLGVRADYLDAAFDELDTVHGSIEAYFADALGLDATAQNALRERFLES
ncbi:tyrosine-protein phosphatase [Gordonia hydrophobica]|uniref:Tyrosine-protein phosphatase n=1 Tax=Gordonia hydrophobica TaxID=40516 RepID=A0ABZ2U465_9ACTN|nr:tyrosine-protein phosphatase [Gordonia hydrophobica]MBM7368026.1 protein-tyrosine phosphatase [Gordonia hydrophobica]